ncbi:ricin-type beta-trefoil lectin domain protein [Algicola sagamiensis]|uniref:ricin-type beta-trefoil lectin domain protein n=1 Tax=Algicola sagamiensis TaxID=163869 RepID=UPI00036CEC98|nr:ricin-type beta-trefoil lectin domain protein [Algicola sagamiensis]
MKKSLTLMIGALIPMGVMADSVDTHTFMERFHSNPAKVMDELPPRTKVAEAMAPYFSKEEIESNEFVTKKDELRQRMIHKPAPRMAMMAASAASSGRGNDNPANLVDLGNNVITNLFELEQKAPRSHRLAEQPWSDTYWPLYSGASAWRYADQDLSNSYPQTWKDYNDFSVNKPVDQYSLETRHLLSPAEKYDLLVGDTGFTLTNNQWDSGRSYYDRSGKVERWMGLCHGWAPAAYMLPRPVNTITVKDANDEDLKLYPSDIKAMGTLLWSNARFDTKFIGGRCNIKDPEKDANGRILDQDCFDNNPGTFHISVLNQIGISERSVILDATYDYQVWNQPILSYKVTYFNPQTSRAVSNAQAGTINLADYTKDKFKSYRAQNTTKVVGVRMDIDYMVETNPNHRTKDDEYYDGITSVSYYYDLEMDDAGNIIGGEWYQNRHPDFLWTPSKNAKAVSWYNGQGNWAEGQTVPQDWKQKAKQASRYGQPLTSIVNELFERSAEGSTNPPQPTPWTAIKLSNSMCLDAYYTLNNANGLLVQEACGNYAEQLFSVNAQGQARTQGTGDLCVTASALRVNATLSMKACNGSNTQKWKIENGVLKSLVKPALKVKSAGGTRIRLKR